MKTLIAPLLLTAAVLLTSGCAGTPTAAPTPTETTKTAPKPDEAQTVALLSELAKVDPSLNDEKSVMSAWEACTTILGGIPAKAEVAATKMAFRPQGSQEMTHEEITRIVDVIKTNGFCKEV